MKIWKVALPAVCLLLLTIVFAACSPEPTGGTSGGGNTTASEYYVNATKINVNGTERTVLTDNHGWTLYYFTDDKPTESYCTGNCAETWPAYVYSSAEKPSYAKEISGNLTTYKTAHGYQLQYEGHLLYKYAGDTAAGQYNGEGVGGKWYVAYVGLK